MNLRRPLTPVLLTALTLVACGDLKDRILGPKKKELADLDPTEAQGDWVRPCHRTRILDGGYHLDVKLKVGPETWSRTDTWSKGDACDQPVLTKELQGHLDIGTTHDERTRELTIGTDAVTVTVFDETLAKALGAAQHCGIAEWPVGKPVAVTDAACRRFSGGTLEVNGLQMPTERHKRQLKFVTLDGSAIAFMGDDLFHRPDDAPAPELGWDACEYRDVPGQAEILLVNDDRVSLRFKPDDAHALDGTWVPLDKGTLTLAAIKYEKSCIDGNGLAPGKTMRMLMQTRTKGDDPACTLAKFQLPDATPEACRAF